MELYTIAKQMVGFHKAVFENSYSGVTAIQDCSQKMLDGYLGQFPWISEECKKNLNESVDFVKKAREEYKNAVVQGFEKLQELTVVEQSK